MVRVTVTAGVRVTVRARVRASAPPMRSCGVVSKKRENGQPPAASSFSCSMSKGIPTLSAARTWLGLETSVRVRGTGTGRGTGRGTGTGTGTGTGRDRFISKGRVALSAARTSTASATPAGPTKVLLLRYNSMCDTSDAVAPPACAAGQG